MQSLAHPPARSLLDRPQRLGFLPTLWFWNDGVRQRELLPIVLPVAFLVLFLTDYLAARFPALDALWTAILLLHPFLVMGMVERHVRKQLRLRPADQRLASAMERSPRRPLSALVPLAVGGSAAVLLAAATLGVGAALVVLSLLTALGVVVRRREQERLRLHADAEAHRPALPGDRDAQD